MPKSIFFFYYFVGGVLGKDFAIVAKLALRGFSAASRPYKKERGGGRGLLIFSHISKSPPHPPPPPPPPPRATIAVCPNRASHVRPAPVCRLHCSALPPHQPRACSLSPALPSVEPWFSRALSSHRRPQLCPAPVSLFPQPATARLAPAVPWPSRGLPWFSRALVQSECEHSALPLPAVSPATPIHSLTTDRHGTYQGWFPLQAHS